MSCTAAWLRSTASTGDMDKAGEACNKALAADPHDYEMLNLRSSLRRQTRNDNHIQELKERLEKGVRDWRGAVQVAYAVSKELEDIEEYDEAFQLPGKRRIVTAQEPEIRPG